MCVCLLRHHILKEGIERGEGRCWGGGDEGVGGGVVNAAEGGGGIASEFATPRGEILKIS